MLVSALVSYTCNAVGACVSYGDHAYKGYWHVFKIDEEGKVHIVNKIVKDVRGAQTGRTF